MKCVTGAKEKIGRGKKFSVVGFPNSQNLMPVEPRFGAPRNSRWRYVIKVYVLVSSDHADAYQKLGDEWGGFICCQFQSFQVRGQ